MASNARTRERLFCIFDLEIGNSKAASPEGNGWLDGGLPGGKLFAGKPEDSSWSRPGEPDETGIGVSLDLGEM
jgi:hypothetical protein